MIELIVAIDETKADEAFLKIMKEEHTELIRCKDCKNWCTKANTGFCTISDDSDMTENDWCSKGKRKDYDK